MTRATAQVLIRRGLDTAPAARDYLKPTLHGLHDPFAFTVMDRAATRIAKAVRTGESIRIFGDYDVDGTTAAALLTRALRALAKPGQEDRITARLPNRLRDGYGLRTHQVEQAASDGASLIITVDNGVTCFEAATRAKELGVDMIVTDHHEPKRDEGGAPAL
ncbi:MAG: DHH family phosphoesterase, partial [Planctomycetota bacterium]